MDNQHRKITGYRDLSQVDIDLMNEIKSYAEQGRQLLAKVAAHVNAQFDATKVYVPIEEEERRMRDRGEKDIPTGMEMTDEARIEWERLVAAEPHRWRAIAQTHLQEGCMAVTRAIAQPSSF